MAATPSIDDWIDEVRARPGSEAVGMMLAHTGIVRGTTRAGEPVAGMELAADRERLARALAEAATWPGVFAVRAWVNEGRLSVGGDIMKVLVAGDIRENVFGALQRFVALVKTEVVSEAEFD